MSLCSVRSARVVLLLTAATAAFSFRVESREIESQVRDSRERALSKWKQLPRERTPKPLSRRQHAICTSDRYRERILCRARPRARLRRWKSLKEKRAGWGIV